MEPFIAAARELGLHVEDKVLSSAIVRDLMPLARYGLTVKQGETVMVEAAGKNRLRVTHATTGGGAAPTNSCAHSD